MRYSKSDGGFSFTDLLVIVAVLLLVVLGGATLFGDFGKETADARRISDIDDLKVALERYHESCRSYPTDLSRVSTPAGDKGSCSVNLLTFINPIPRDPVTDEPYSYQVSHADGSGKAYCLGTDLDNNDHPKANSDNVTFPIDISCTGDYIIIASPRE